MTSRIEAQQPATPPTAKATGAQTGVRKNMAQLTPVATFEVGGDPDWMAVTDDAVWVTIASKNQVKQLRAKDNAVGFIVSVKEPCSGLVAAYGSLWIPSCGSHNLARVSLGNRKTPGKNSGCARRFRRRHHGRGRQCVDGQQQRGKAGAH